MDKVVRRYANAEDALPTSWKTSTLPRSTPKRRVGRHKKRPAPAPVDIPDVSVRNRLAFESSCDGFTNVTQDLCDMRDTRCDMTGNDDVTSCDVSVSCFEVTTSAVTCAGFQHRPGLVEDGLRSPAKQEGSPPTNGPPNHV